MIPSGFKDYFNNCDRDTRSEIVAELLSMLESPGSGQLEGSGEKEQLNPKHELYLLSEEIDWDYFENEFSGRLVRELERKLPEGDYAKELELYKKVLTQEQYSKNKIYSLHEPEVYCMSKGKAHKKHEYGCKASVVLTETTGIIVGAMTFKTNMYDTKIQTPKPSLKKDNAYQRRKKRKHHRRRAAIEPIIAHLKHDHRAARNFLKGQIGNSLNFMMAAAGFNFKKLMKKIRKTKLWLFFKTQMYFCSSKILKVFAPIGNRKTLISDF